MRACKYTDVYKQYIYIYTYVYSCCMILYSMYIHVCICTSVCRFSICIHTINMYVYIYYIYIYKYVWCTGISACPFSKSYGRFGKKSPGSASKPRNDSKHRQQIKTDCGTSAAGAVTRYLRRSCNLQKS